ncbi:MAG: hypothetical protein EZS28_000204 [Streblomastix strix]|uniref:Uncharacterized protein n=1 Tax=Streblomastix strix TaxID=222440 RepID=A0A5J4XAE2_9EUKA|nr:MAG: hypothetical protein EZS28_000201 [Streblomastix strix]KAA6404271.1 MAG: hypothetical protein EZS28_000204 [Streblomastix strix]
MKATVTKHQLLTDQTTRTKRLLSNLEEHLYIKEQQIHNITKILVEKDTYLQFSEQIMIPFGCFHPLEVEAAYVIRTIHLMKLLKQ